MKTLKLSLAVALAAVLSVAQAAGPLLTTDNPRNPQPLRWDMSKGPVKVYTDIGDYAYKIDGSVFLNNVQADKITAFALKQWSDVTTSTWKAVNRSGEIHEVQPGAEHRRGRGRRRDRRQKSTASTTKAACTSSMTSTAW